MQIHRILILIATLTVGAGCASTGGGMSARDCDGADWRALGLEDGLEGAPATRFQERRETCAGAAKAPDIVGYNEGYKQGLASFCQPRGGFEHGRAGKEYAWVCDREVEPAFIQAYQVGYREYELREAVRDAERDINRMERDMRNAQNEVQRLQAQYNNSANNSMSERMRLQSEVEALRRRIAELQQDRAIFRNALNQAELALSNHRKNQPNIPGVE